MIPKFRAWDKRENTMRDVAVLHFTKGGKVNSIEYWKTPSELKSYHVRNLVLMQSTGLKDKNGVEIFEGDIGWDDHLEVHGQVIFENGAFKYEWDNISEDLFEVTDDIEIVGNIYENPELLEVAE
ncbi:YopX family protein [Enterococcus faecalis]|uniref:YopX family protein n=4 Tax=Enterococcus faecalis TaxID=1351 RepID=UPI000CF6E5FE|nr:YopX family protein [Enterococcus faecalis]EGP9917852.1 DNA-packaging protein [Listeria monocytogenes]EGO2723968.1 DNA-packaging protein [Enterococcus faecalis]EGO5161300.1 DNA-packaging protein [Enterococcus faecalis]EGO5970527.1 DNA-packaging protein [Enterococcus faecalis]EGO7908293.1 DNA-packaging protein [Enterococcus faecalis]